MSLFTDHVKIRVSGVNLQVAPRLHTASAAQTSSDTSGAAKRRNFNLQEINKLKKEALKHTEESYMPTDPKVSLLSVD